MGKIKFILLIFLSFKLSAQIKISGTIENDKYEPVISASVILKDNDNTTITYTYTNEKGNFVLTTSKKGNFTLFVNAMSYEQKNYELEINDIDLTSLLFTLTPKVNQIKEVTIKSVKPITEAKDKIIFNADAFKTGDEQVVEDLLKKIPGLTVDANGTIKVGNQEVEKVMIDGDDMFEKGYRILTKNMPVNPIDKVELLQKYSNNKLLKVIENSDKVALNLTLKEDAKRVWFGNFEGGYGLFSENRYEVRSNLMNFGKKNKYYFLTNMNNVGYDATGDINSLIRPFRFNEPGSIGDNQLANTLLNLDFSLPNFKQKRVNLNNAEMLSLNSIFTVSKKIKIKGLGFLNTDEINFFRNNFEQFFLNNTTFENSENFIGRNKQISGFGKIDFTYNISENKTIEYTFKINNTESNNNSIMLFNDTSLNEKLQSNNELLDNKIVITNKINENKALIISGRYINEKAPQNYTVNQFISNDLFTENANNTTQFSENKMAFAGFETHFFNKKDNGNLFEVKIGNEFRKDNLNTQFNLLNDNSSLTFPLDYQNNLIYTTNNLYLSTKYNFKFNKFSFSPEASFNQLSNNLENFDTSKKQTPFFIIPKLGIHWKINSKNKIATSYLYNTTNAKVLDVFSGFVQTGFRSFSKGLEQFNQLNASSASLIYTFGNYKERFFANAIVLYTKNHDFFSSNAIIAQNFSQSEKILIKDQELINISTNLDQYFKPIKSNLKITLSYNEVNFKNVVNNSNLREVKNIGKQYGFELRSGFKGFFNYHFGSKWDNNQVITTTKNSFISNVSFLDLSFMFSEKFSFQAQTERYFFQNLEASKTKYYFLDIEARYIVKKNKLTFALSGNNLFNENSFKNVGISDISVSTTQFRLQPRFGLLKMEWRF